MKCVSASVMVVSDENLPVLWSLRNDRCHLYNRVATIYYLDCGLKYSKA